MSCIAKFKIGDKEIDLNLETGSDTPLTDQELLQILQDNPEKRQELCNAIQNALYKHNTIEPVKVSDLIGMEGLKGNTDLEFLSNEFPNIIFPQGVSTNVLLIDNLKIGKQNIYGRVINSNGQEVFVVRNSTSDVQKLANFLTVRKQMENQSFIFDEDSNYQKDLESCLKERNKKNPTVHSTFDLLLDFIYNRSKYDSLYFTNSKGKTESVYAYLSSVNNTILEYSNRVVFSDPFVNTINQLRTHLDTNEGFISYQALYGAIEQYHKEILDQLGIESLKDFKEFFQQDGPSDVMQGVFPQYDGQNRYKTLLDGLFSSEPEFTWNYVRTSNKGLILKSSPRTIQAKYGIEYDTIHSFDIVNDDFFGYRIYSFSDQDGNKKFLASRGFLTEDSYSKKYNSIEEVQAYIQNSVSKQDIKKNSFIEFKHRQKLEDGWTTQLDSYEITSQQSLIPGTIIESIDIPVDANQEFYNSNESNLFKVDRQNYDSFSRIVRGWPISEELKNNILGNINTPEKIATFIYKINEQLKADRTNEQELTNILEDITQAKKNYYYIDTKKLSGNGYRYRVIPTEPIQIDNYKHNKQTPIIELISAIGQVMQNSFGVNINMITSRELSERFPDINADTTKAFVRDGEIFINTTTAEATDPLHEFTHLVLGVLKSNRDLRRNYEQLMQIISQTNQGRSRIQKLRDIYEGVSEIDLAEEAFVDLFGQYVMGQLKPGFQELFQSVDKYMKDATKIVFNNPVEDLASFYGTSLESVFKRFNSDVASLLGGSGIDFQSTKQSRRLSNWINEQIRKEEIKEECYG